MALYQIAPLFHIYNSNNYFFWQIINRHRGNMFLFSFSFFFLHFFFNFIYHKGNSFQSTDLYMESGDIYIHEIFMEKREKNQKFLNENLRKERRYSNSLLIPS